MDQSRIHPWAEGGDPEEFGWVFDDTGANVNAYELAYETPTREKADDRGIPDDVLEAYEADAHYTADNYGDGLCDFLQNTFC